MVTVRLVGRRGLLGGGFLPPARRFLNGSSRAYQATFGRRSGVSRIAMRASGSPPSGLSLKRAKPAKVNQKQTQQHRKRLGSGKRQPVSAFAGAPSSVRAACSDRRSSSAMDLSRINQAEDTTAEQGLCGRGRFRVPGCDGAPATTKRAARRPPFSKNDPLNRGQLASLAAGLSPLDSVAGLSIAALSPLSAAVAGADALTLTPWSRSSAIFRALSSLASGGT